MSHALIGVLITCRREAVEPMRALRSEQEPKRRNSWCLLIDLRYALLLVSAVLMRSLHVADPKSLVRLVVLLVAALIAGLISSSRAASVDPIRALWAE
jgi:hypothetical protein